MALASGTKLGPYEIESPLGAGGMGEVYRARDMRLQRTVAIKVLNAQLVGSAEARARFEREAKIISKLQHPHICVLHDVGKEGLIDYLVMEFLQGGSLADRLREGPLACEEVLRIAIQIADALARAHRAGVVHRDLKPGNVMLTKSGAKLLDFGLAKPLSAMAASGTGSGASPSVLAVTQTTLVSSPATPLSTAGAVIGTVQYMSPEQIQGIEADARSDIFSFGVMLFEMVTGKRAFEGKAQASIVGQVLAVDPPAVSSLRPETPQGLDRVIRLCLHKDPDERIQSAHDLKLQLLGIAEAPLAITQASAVVPARLSWFPWVAAGMLAIATMAFAVAYFQSLRAPQISVHSSILPPEKMTFQWNGSNAGTPALSPDGLRIAIVLQNADRKQMLWIRPLNSADAQPMSGTEGATNPFWSADSRYVGFFAAGKLKKLDAGGGPPQTLCDAAQGRGGTWNHTGTIVFARDTNSGLSRVDAGGGAPTALTTLAPRETSHRWPDFLPDGNHFLYFAGGATNAENGIYLAALDSKQRKLLLHNDSNATYAAPGYLLFVGDSTLVAQRFNLRSLTLEGDAKPMGEHVAVTATARSILAASPNGELLFQHGTGGGGSQLFWYDASGKQGELVLPETADYHQPALSPDASKLAFALETNGVADIWVVDLARHTRTRLTFGPQYSGYPIWWPDGKSVVFTYGLSGNGGDAFYRQNADGTGSREKLLETPGIVAIPFSVSPDGRYIAYMRRDPNTGNGYDIWAVPMFPDKSGEQKPFPVVATNFLDVSPSFSPDGKWLAYANNETGRQEVYIQPFPTGVGRWQVSTAGGTRPNWRKDGRELFFFSPDQQIMAVDVNQKGASLQLGAPHALFKAITVSASTGPYTVSPDGKRFVMNTVIPQSIAEPLTLITNWSANLK